MNELALFAGAGGGILGGHLLGWRTVCAVEWEPYAAAVLAARQNDGILPPFPIWDDVRTFDGRPWRGLVDVVSGGFPCQDISAAGAGAGIDGARSGLWSEMARIISEVRPRYVFVENSPVLTSRGLGRVLGDLASLGFDAKWGVLGAAHAGAPHLRERIWIVADSERTERWTQREARNGLARQECVPQREESAGWLGKCAWWSPTPDIPRVANGLAARLDRHKATGNGQVPRVAAAAFTLLSDF
ncbi:DNA cytosine methyltransferase [Chromobacterium phragmitis]|uniref:DNA cytosine methyltransferase n=1 Tax=Chromobacterium phragmitis TaxID=2202141 RepID=UPI003877D816